MADKGSSGEKTEKPTPKRKKESREQGQIARSNDIPGWLTVLILTYLFPFTIRSGYEQGQMMFADIGGVLEGGEGAMLSFFGDAMFRAVLVTAPVVCLALVVGVLGQVAQIGWAPKKMKPDVKRLNPIKGLKQMFSAKMGWDIAKNLMKLGLIIAVGMQPIREAYMTIYTATSLSTQAIAGVIADLGLGFLRTTAIFGLAISAFDYLQSKKQVDKQTKMSKEEVKQEHKQSEGDPQVKGQIRQRQMAMSRNRMMAEVPNADAILVNPTHIAVAIRYDPLKGAPEVLAKGAGAIADKIREIAEEESIPIVRDVPLARTIFRLVDVGQQIPAELYEAVAKVLAFIYALRHRGRAAGYHTSPFADANQRLMDLEKPARQRRGAPVG